MSLAVLYLRADRLWVYSSQTAQMAAIFKQPQQPSIPSSHIQQIVLVGQGERVKERIERPSDFYEL